MGHPGVPPCCPISCLDGYAHAGRADDAARIPGCTARASEAWRLNREAMLLLGAGPAGAPAPARPSGGRRRRGRPLRFPGRPVAPAGGDAAQLPDDRVRDDRRRPAAEIRRLNTLHREITGPGYAARDPELGLWVHATLIDSTIAVADAWLEPLAAARRAAFYEETRPVGRAFGVPDALLPADLEAFERYVAEHARRRPGPVRVSAVARELAGVVLRPPLGPLAPWLAAIPAAALRLDAVAVGRACCRRRCATTTACLGSARAPRLGLARGRLARLASDPARRSFRQMPQALAADRRTGARRPQ